MKAPKPTKKTFPPSWKKWRKLRVGETLRASDRVVYTWRSRKGQLVEKQHSMALGVHHVGMRVSAAKVGNEYPCGWYYRKVS